jgi:hypothetical protein
MNYYRVKLAVFSKILHAIHFACNNKNRVVVLVLIN